MKSQDYAIFKRLLEQHEKNHHNEKPPRHGDTWFQVEDDVLMEGFNKFIKDYSYKFGRTEYAIKIRLLILLRG